MTTTTNKKPCWLDETLPPPVAHEYAPKGTWEQGESLKLYISGPRSSTRALIVLYDAFGACSQIIQGVDRLSQYLDSLIIMPDFFKGRELDHDEFAKDPAAFMPKVGEFLKTHGNIANNSQVLLELVPELRTRFPTVTSWGAFGLCWGGKVAVVTSVAEGNPFKVSGQAHPAQLSASDAHGLTIPHICMPSKDEPQAAVEEYEKILGKSDSSKVVRFPTMFHGWMGARADLSDPEIAAEYERGYRVAAEFFAQHL